MADFRASLGLFAEGQERAKNPATGWLCWQSLAKASLDSKFPVERENTGNFVGFNSLLGAKPQHTQGISTGIPY